MKIKYSRLSTQKINKIIKCFCFNDEHLDINASNTAKALWLNRKTINKYFLYFRKLIYKGHKDLLKNVNKNDEDFLYYSKFWKNKFRGTKQNNELFEVEMIRRYWKNSENLEAELKKLIKNHN